MIYFKDDIFLKLKKQENMSGLIDGLVRKYFDGVESMSLDEVRLEIRKKELEEEYQKKMGEIENGNI